MGLVTPRPRRAERGQALLTALVAVVLLGAAFALLASLLVARMNRVRDEVRRTELTALLDGAMAETLANLATSSVYPGVQEHPLGGGAIRTEVRHGAGGQFVIRAEARLHGARLAVEARGHTTDTGPRVTSWQRVVPEVEGVEGGRTRPPG